MTEENAPYGSPRIAAVIGCGSIGRRHAHNLNRLGYAVRTWDLDPARCTVPTLNEALDGATLAVIVTPPAAHMEGALAVRDAGVPWLLIEKPLAPSFADVAMLLSWKQPNIVVGYCLRFALATQDLREALPRIAPLRLVEAVYSERPAHRPAWLEDPIQGGATLEYSHILDLLLWLFGKPTFVQAQHVGVPDQAVVAALRWPDGLLGTVRMDFLSPTETRIKVIGDRGVVEWYRDMIVGPGCEKYTEHSAAWLLHEAEELHAVIKGALPGSPRLCSVEEALAVLELADHLRAR